MTNYSSENEIITQRYNSLCRFLLILCLCYNVWCFIMGQNDKCCLMGTMNHDNKKRTKVFFLELVSDLFGI